MIHTLVWLKRHLLDQLAVPEVSLLTGHIRPSDVLLDVGGHAGAWTVALSRLVPQGTVYVFEALPYYARVLRATLQALGKTNVVVVNGAVLHESKRVEMVWRDPEGARLTGLTHLKGADESAQGTISVDGLTLDGLLRSFGGRVRFMKLDIEGAELFALRGAEQLLSTFRPLLYIELNEAYCRRYGHTPKDVFDFLAAQDYRAFVCSADGVCRGVEAGTYSGAGDVWFLPVEEDLAFGV